MSCLLRNFNTAHQKSNNILWQTYLQTTHHNSLFCIYISMRVFSLAFFRDQMNRFLLSPVLCVYFCESITSYRFFPRHSDTRQETQLFLIEKEKNITKYSIKISQNMTICDMLLYPRERKANVNLSLVNIILLEVHGFMSILDPEIAMGYLYIF